MGEVELGILQKAQNEARWWYSGTRFGKPDSHDAGDDLAIWIKLTQRLRRTRLKKDRRIIRHGWSVVCAFFTFKSHYVKTYLLACWWAFSLLLERLFRWVFFSFCVSVWVVLFLGVFTGPLLLHDELTSVANMISSSNEWQNVVLEGK